MQAKKNHTLNTGGQKYPLASALRPICSVIAMRPSSLASILRCDILIGTMMLMDGSNGDDRYWPMHLPFSTQIICKLCPAFSGVVLSLRSPVLLLCLSLRDCFGDRDRVPG